MRFGQDDDFCGECRYRPDESNTYRHVGSPLDGAWRVEMLPVSMKRIAYVNVAVMKKVTTMLRRKLSMFGKVRMLPDGFVHMSTLFAQGHMLSPSKRHISRMFRCSWMNTSLDESGTRFAIVLVS